MYHLSTSPFIAITSFFCIALLTHSALSAPAEKSPKCTTYASGFLTTSKLNSGIWKPFSFNSNNEVAFWNKTTGHGTIFAQFQTCTPNYAGGSNIRNPNFPSETQYYGRVFIPKLNQCLAITNADSHTGPYFVKAKPCPNSAKGEMTTKKSIPYNFMFRTFTQDTSRKILLWIGKTKADGTNPQGGCEGGVLGYLRDKQSSTPIVTTQGNHRISLVCADTAHSGGPFGELRPSL